MSNHEEISVSPMDADAETIVDTLWLYALTKYPNEDERDTFWHKVASQVQSFGKAHGVFPPPEECPECGDEYTWKDIDGGQCSCGATIYPEDLGGIASQTEVTLTINEKE